MRMEIGMPTGLPVSSCRTSTRAPGTSRVSAVCNGPIRLVGEVLVGDLDEDLRIVHLALLGSTENQKRGPPPPMNVVSVFKTRSA